MNLKQAEERLIVKMTVGSHAYGTNIETSDIDTRGVFTLPPDRYFELNQAVEQVSDSTNDTTYFTLLRFLKLASDANPNVLELLFVPESCIRHITPEWQEVLSIKNAFISRRVLYTYGGYARSQIKRARGQNKLINNPMSKKKPTKEDFCWIIPMYVNPLCGDDGISKYTPGKKFVVKGFELKYPEDMPFRPIKAEDLAQCATPWDLSEFHAAGLEHAIDIYRLYHYGNKSKGVFRGDDSADIVCEDIPISDEFDRFSGILIYHKDAYERELKLWHQYWDWIKNRNEARWKDQEGMITPVDFKNISHCMRLIYEGEHILENGYPMVRFTGDKLERLKNIRAGKVDYNELVNEADERLIALDDKAKKSNLPKSADFDRINKLSKQLHTL